MRRISHSYSQKDQRRDHRFEQPLLSVEIDGRAFAAGDWSLGGVRLRGLVADVYEGMEMMLKFSGVRSGYLHAGEIAAEVVRIDDLKGETVLRFTRFDGAAFDALEGLITGRRPRAAGAVWATAMPSADAIATTSP